MNFSSAVFVMKSLICDFQGFSHCCWHSSSSEIGNACGARIYHW